MADQTIAIEMKATTAAAVAEVGKLNAEIREATTAATVAGFGRSGLIGIEAPPPAFTWREVATSCCRPRRDTVGSVLAPRSRPGDRDTARELP